MVTEIRDITASVLPEIDGPTMWIGLFLDSYRNDLRLSGRFEDADYMRRVMEKAGIPVSDLDLVSLRKFRDEYGERRGKPGASLVDLEMF